MKREEAVTDVKIVQVSLVTNGVILVRAVDVPVLVMMYRSALDAAAFIEPVSIQLLPCLQAKLRSRCQLPHP